MTHLVFASAELVMREAALFAAAGFLLFGISDLIVDLLWLGLVLRRKARGAPDGTAAPAPKDRSAPAQFAIFIPAWDESAVIGQMLTRACAVLDDRVRFYVGCYPNDPATIAAVRAVPDARIRLVVGGAPGPTSKAACLNTLWEAMRADEADRKQPFAAIILHDAEDVVHSGEIDVFAAMIPGHDLVQLPVVPLIDRTSRWVGAHYADEFAEAHGKALVVRQALGAGLPSAGVGCAIARGALDRLAARHGVPFDVGSLTEDYELGLRLHALGGRAAFVRLTAGPRRPIVAIQGYFPATLQAAVTQKARWMTGIALAGWDRLGWQGGIAERWMRMRDRQAVLAAVLLFAAYVALLCGGMLAIGTWLGSYRAQPVAPLLALLLTANLGLLVWRLAMRFGFVTHSYGWREGLRAVPRIVVANIIAMLAARRAVGRYLLGRRTGTPIWDKTAHAFPAQLPAE